VLCEVGDWLDLKLNSDGTCQFFNRGHANGDEDFQFSNCYTGTFTHSDGKLHLELTKHDFTIWSKEADLYKRTVIDVSTKIDLDNQNKNFVFTAKTLNLDRVLKCSLEKFEI
jgi:hypothetical protein